VIEINSLYFCYKDDYDKIISVLLVCTYELVIEVINADCIDTCIRLIKENPDNTIGLLNMASERTPGGGAKNPERFIRAQEEDIVRRTSLYASLSKQKYPLEPDELIFTPNVKIVKTSDYKILNTDYLNITGVVSAAAIRRPILINNIVYSQYDLNLLHNKITMLLETFEYHHIQILVLGAWGCGVFRNPPRQVAQAFKDIIYSDRFKCSFKKIVFFEKNCEISIYI
jgi:uncharacterized protein (TIGR02452 family)